MKLPERWPVCAKWFVVWLVVLPVILHCVEYSGVFSSGLSGLLAGGRRRVRSVRPAGGLCGISPLP